MQDAKNKAMEEAAARLVACACARTHLLGLRLLKTDAHGDLYAGASRNKENVKTTLTSKKPVDLGEHNFDAHAQKPHSVPAFCRFVTLSAHRHLPARCRRAHEASR